MTERELDFKSIAERLEIRAPRYSTDLKKYTAELYLEEERLGEYIEWTFTNHIEIGWAGEVSRDKFLKWMNSDVLPVFWPEMPSTKETISWFARLYWKRNTPDEERTVALLAQHFYNQLSGYDRKSVTQEEAVVEAKETPRAVLPASKTRCFGDLVVAVRGPMRVELYDDRGESSLRPLWLGSPHICQSPVNVAGLKESNYLPTALRRCPFVSKELKSKVDVEFPISPPKTISSSLSVRRVRYSADLSVCRADVYLRKKKVGTWKRATFADRGSVRWLVHIDSIAAGLAADEPESVNQAIDRLVDEYWFMNLNEKHATALFARRLALNEGWRTMPYSEKVRRYMREEDFEYYYMMASQVMMIYIERAYATEAGIMVCGAWEHEQAMLCWLPAGRRDFLLEWITYEDTAPSLVEQFRGAGLDEYAPPTCPHQ